MIFPFGSHTQAALIDAICDGYSHADMGTLFMRVGIDQWDVRGEGVNKATRAQRVIQGLRDDLDSAAHAKALELATEVVTHGDIPESPWGRNKPMWWQPLVDALSGDGFDWDGAAQRLFPAAEGLDVAEEYGVLEARLKDLGWTTPATHYRQALQALADGHWESANAQVRSFLESFVPHLASDRVGRPLRSDFMAALQDLNSQDILFPGEFDFARGFWKLANPRGSHAGLSDREEARFRVFVATAYARFLLSRLPGATSQTK